VIVGTIKENGGSPPGKRPVSKRTGAIVTAVIVLVGTLAVANQPWNHRGASDRSDKNASALDMPEPANPAGVASGEAKVKHPPRRLDDVNRRELESTLPQGASIEISATEGDGDALRLAQDIRAFLQSEHYPVTDVAPHVSNPPAKGVGLEALPDGRWRVIVGADE
jgi:hypothetical protein